MPTKKKAEAGAEATEPMEEAVQSQGDGARQEGRRRGPGVNIVILIGRLAAEPDIRVTPSGLHVANLRLATNGASETQFHDLVAFGSTAEFAGAYLQTGRLVYAGGRLDYRIWHDRDGNRHRHAEVIVNRLQSMGSRPPQEPATSSS